MALLSTSHSANPIDMCHLTTDLYPFEACATCMRNPYVIVEQCRHLARDNQFSNDVIRLTLACLDGGLLSTDRYISSNYQKFSKRQLKSVADTATAPYKRGRRPGNTVASGKPSTEGTGVMKSQAGSEDTDDSDSSGAPGDVDKGQVPSTVADEPRTAGNDTVAVDRGVSAATPATSRVIKANPVALVHYAQISMCAKSFQSAICKRRAFFVPVG
jgi:general transcription factor 3C polypeptide 3 (transcription factor C subunit 4)